MDPTVLPAGDGSIADGLLQVLELLSDLTSEGRLRPELVSEIRRALHAELARSKQMPGVQDVEIKRLQEAMARRDDRLLASRCMLLMRARRDASSNQLVGIPAGPKPPSRTHA